MSKFFTTQKGEVVNIDEIDRVKHYDDCMCTGWYVYTKSESKYGLKISDSDYEKLKVILAES